MKANPLTTTVTTTGETETNDNLAALVTLLAQSVSKMPLLHSSGRMLADISQTGPQSAFQPWIMNAVSSTGTGQVYYLTNMPWNLSDAGANKIYSQITVS